jgi:hypothetical protein
MYHDCWLTRISLSAGMTQKLTEKILEQGIYCERWNFEVILHGLDSLL